MNASHDIERVLRRVAGELRMPLPAKARVLLELRADIEALAVHYRRAGLTEAAALERALERFDPSVGVIAELAALHASPLQKLSDRLAERGRTRTERTALALVLLVALVVLAPLLGALVDHGSAALWLALLPPSIGVIAAARSGWRLWLALPAGVQRPRRGLDLPLAMAAVSLMLGLLGAAVETRQLANALASMDVLSLPALALALRDIAATLVAAHLGALVCLALWFVLLRRAETLERAAAAPFLELPPGDRSTATLTTHPTAGSSRC